MAFEPYYYRVYRNHKGEILGQYCINPERPSWNDIYKGSRIDQAEDACQHHAKLYMLEWEQANREGIVIDLGYLT